MAQKFLTPIDMTGLEVRNMLIHQGTAFPSSPVAGQVFYRTDQSKFYIYISSWTEISQGASHSAVTLTTAAQVLLSLSGQQIDLPVQNANKAFVGPSSGGDAAPTFRLLVAGDIPTLDHTKTSDFDSQVNTHKVTDLAAPVGNWSMNSHKITNVTDPTSAQDAATKNYVDNTAAGLNAKQSAKAATTANITLSGTQTVDGIALIALDRCLVKNQTTQSANGIYAVQSGTWTRTLDTDTWAELVDAYTWVEQGTVNADTGWVCTVDGGGTLETTSVTFVQFTASTEITNGDGLTKTGQTLSANIDTAEGLKFDASSPKKMQVNVDNTTLDFTGGAVEIKSLGVATGNLAALAVTTAKIAASAVDNTKLANMAANSIKGNNTGGSAAAADLTVAQTKTLLALAVADVSGAAPLASPTLTGTPAAPTPATADNSTTIATTAFVKAQSYLTANQNISLTGDVTGGPAATSIATTIGTNKVGNTQLAQMAANTLKGNNTGGTANAADLTVAQVKTLLGLPTTAVSKYASNVGNGSLTSIVVNHALNTQDVTVLVREAGGSYNVVYPDIQVTDANNVTLIFAVAPTLNQYRAIVTG